MSSIAKFKYPVVFGSFLLAITTSFIFREHLMPSTLKSEGQNFCKEDQPARQLLTQTINEMKASAK